MAAAQVGKLTGSNSKKPLTSDVDTRDGSEADAGFHISRTPLYQSSSYSSGSMTVVIHFNAIYAGSNFTGVTNPSGLTVSIEQSTCCNTFSAVLPMNKPAIPARLTVPITMRSIAFAWASSVIKGTASPFNKYTFNF